MNEPVPISEALADYIAKRGIAHSSVNSRIQTVWDGICDERFRAVTSVIRLYRGVLEIGVSSAAILNELNSFHYANLLKELRDRCGHEMIRELRFQLKTHNRMGN